MEEEVKKYYFAEVEKYYLAEFKKIENGELSWNWAAFWFLPYWVCFRKMYAGYLKGILLSIIMGFIAGIVVFAFASTLSSPGPELIGLLISLLGPMICGGFLGNRWYYSTIKHRIQKGYHLYKDYDSTSLLWLSTSIFSSIVMMICPKVSPWGIGIVFFVFLLAIAVPFICYHKDDKVVTKLAMDNSNFSKEINEENISKLL